ncbi:MAG TPA: hypothetical protein V6D48_25780 [Oculatellaceae cyanobacterium]
MRRLQLDRAKPSTTSPPASNSNGFNNDTIETKARTAQFVEVHANLTSQIISAAKDGRP